MSRSARRSVPFTVRIVEAETPLDRKQMIQILLRGVEYRPDLKVALVADHTPRAPSTVAQQAPE